MRKCKLITLIILISIKIACGQNSTAYSVVNGTYVDFLSVWLDTTFEHYYLLNVSYKMPDLTRDTALVDSLSKFIPKEEVLKMLTDTNSRGIVWKQRFLNRAKVINEKKAKQLSTRETFEKMQLKIHKLEDKVMRKDLPMTKNQITSKYCNFYFQFSFPVFDSKKEYAIIYMTMERARECFFFCHLKNGKFDKVKYASCMTWSS
jgi:hypothetical protein